MEEDYITDLKAVQATDNLTRIEATPEKGPITQIVVVNDDPRNYSQRWQKDYAAGAKVTFRTDSIQMSLSGFVKENQKRMDELKSKLEANLRLSWVCKKVNPAIKVKCRDDSGMP